MNAPHLAVKRYQRDDMEAVLKANRHVVDRCARMFVRRTGMFALYDDLWAAGAVGLLEAARRYAPERGVQFSTFVEHRVRGAMLDELRRLDHLPRRLRKRVSMMKRSRRELEQAGGGEVTTEAIAKHAGLTVEAVEALSLIDDPPIPLSEDVARVRMSDDPTPDDLLGAGQRKEQLKAAIDQLPDRLRTLLALRYHEDLTYREIASIFELSEPRIAQLHAQALKRLRITMHGTAR